MDLKEVKAKIRIESADPEVNDWVYRHIQMEDDCFGKNYKSTHPECKDCAVLASIDDRREPINVFCRELVTGQAIPEEKEDKEVNDSMKENKTKFARALLADGKSKEEVILALVAQYATEGKDEKWATSRAKSIFRSVKEEEKPTKAEDTA